MEEVQKPLEACGEIGQKWKSLGPNLSFSPPMKWNEETWRGIVRRGLSLPTPSVFGF